MSFECPRLRQKRLTRITARTGLETTPRGNYTDANEASQRQLLRGSKREEPSLRRELRSY